MSEKTEIVVDVYDFHGVHAMGLEPGFYYAIPALDLADPKCPPGETLYSGPFETKEAAYASAEMFISGVLAEAAKEKASV